MALAEGLTVFFHGKIDPLNLDFGLTCEEIIEKCLKYLQQKVCVGHAPENWHMFLPVFGLVTLPEERIWMPHCHVFKRTLERDQKYRLRVRYRPPAGLFDGGNVMYEYLFIQVLDDFLMGPLGKRKHDALDKQKLFGLLAVALLFPDTLPLDNLQTVDTNFKSRDMNVWNFTNLMSKEIVKRFIGQIMVDHVWVYRALKREIKKYKGHSNPQKVSFYKHNFYKLLMESVPDYCFETYKAKSISKDKAEDVTVNLALYEEGGREPGLYYGEVRECSLIEIYEMKLKKPKNSEAKSWIVEISVKSGPPMILEFNEEGMAESFITMVQGYYNLCIRYDDCLCKELQTTASEISSELKSFGPLKSHTAQHYLEDPKGVAGASSACFLIHESLSEHNKYVVVASLQKNLKPGGGDGETRFVEMAVECAGNRQFSLRDEKGARHFSGSLELRRELNSKFGQQIIPKYFSTIAEISENFKVEIEYYGIDVTPRQEEEGVASGPLPVIKDDLTNKESIQDKNPQKSIKKFKVDLNETQMMLVELTTDDEKISKSFREGLEKLVKLNRVKKSRFLKIYCPVMEAKLSVLMEFPPKSDLLTYICKHPQTVTQKVSIMYQMVKILEVTEEKKIYHGNLRLRKFMVFPGDEGFAHIKLGDPGISSYLDSLDVRNEDNIERVPWLSPERRKKLSEITYESECYALGTTFCELLYRSDQFHEELKLKDENLLDYLTKNHHLPCPSFLADKEEGQDEESNKESRVLLPEAKEVLEDVWKVILKCWSADKEERPSAVMLMRDFNEIKTKAEEIQADTSLDELKNVAYDAGINEEKLKEGNRALTEKELNNRLNMIFDQKYLQPHCIDMGGYKCQLGSGFFGTVWQAKYRDPVRNTQENASQCEWKPVAVKQMKKVKGLDTASFTREVLLACDLNHPNIVKVLHLSKAPYHVNTGFCRLMMLMEFMDGGNLTSYATSLGKSKSPQIYVSRMLNICLDVAKGMVYLSGKDIVHRDLAARNILLSINPDKTVTAKVSDFGLSRTMEGNYRFYKLNSETVLPFYWMPPECLEYDTNGGKFSTKGDVWSYGIVMWEAFSSGENPKIVMNIPSKGRTPHLDLFEKFRGGWRLPKRPFMDENVYAVMKECWQMEPELRPPFVDMVEKLKELIQQTLPQLP